MKKSMRITGGIAKSIQLSSPGGMGTRPATDLSRGAVFSSIGGIVEGAIFLDLFAGTGAYGLEAMSRGANGGIFVEKNREAVRCIEQNLKSVGKSMGIEDLGIFSTQQKDVFSFKTERKFNLVFVDPPYELIRSDFLKIFNFSIAFLQEGGRLVFEMPGDYEPQELEGVRELRKLGKEGFNQPAIRIYSH